MQQDDAQPVGPERRIVAIDALRGVALFGVLSVNLITGFRVSIFQQFLPSSETGTWLDNAVQASVSVGMELKAFALFSVLFGVGLAIQFERLAKQPRRFALLLRRLLALLAFGLVHLCLIWNGDILTEYALMGLLVLPFLYLPTRVLFVASVLGLTLYAALPFLLPDNFFWAGGAWLQQQVQTATAIYANGSWPQVVRYNFHEVANIIPLHMFVAPRTFALFLLGVLAWRTGLLREPERHRLLLAVMAIAGLVLGFGMSLLESPSPSSPWYDWSALISIGITLGPVVLAIGYGATVISLYTFTRADRGLGVVAPLGRMAFSNYLAQSLIFGWVFFGWGLGQFGRMSPSQAMLLGVVVYAAQVIVSGWWLGRYRFGPMEWVWRAAMYGGRQPWHISAP